MKPAPLIINIPKPCSENWDQMKPEAQGRFCASCQKTVIDFTHFTDAQLIAFMNADGSAHQCGRYHPSQLSREVVSVKPSRSFGIILTRRIAASFLFFQTLANTAFAQTAKPKITQQPTAKQTDSAEKERILKGCVKDQASGSSIKGVYIEVLGWAITAVTDSTGKFELFFPKDFNKDYVTLHARSPLIAKGVIEDKVFKVGDTLFNTEIVLYSIPKGGHILTAAEIGKMATRDISEVADNSTTMGLYQLPRKKGDLSIGGARPEEAQFTIIDNSRFIDLEPAPKPRRTFFQKIGNWFKRKK